MQTFTFRDEEMTLVFLNYTNGNPAIRAVDQYGAPYAMLTVNVEGFTPGPGEYLIKTWSENASITAAALAAGVFVDTEGRVPTGHVTAQIWKLA